MTEAEIEVIEAAKRYVLWGREMPASNALRRAVKKLMQERKNNAEETIIDK